MVAAGEAEKAAAMVVEMVVAMVVGREVVMAAVTAGEEKAAE